MTYRVRHQFALLLLLVSCTNTTEPTVTAPVMVDAEWAQLPQLPAGPRSDHSAVWTGDEVIIWGGRQDAHTYSSDGAAFDPRHGTWRAIAPSSLEGRYRHTAVWSGSEMLVFGGLANAVLDDGAAYDPNIDRWRDLPDAPSRAVSDHAAVWTGRLMVVFGGRISASNNVYSAAAAAYDPVAGVWRTLPESPLSPREDAAVVWTGEEVIIWGGVGNDGWLADGAAYNPDANAWRSIAPSPLDARQAALAVWTGSVLLVAGGVANVERFKVGAALYDPGQDTWSEIGGPVNPSWSVGAWTGEVLIHYGSLAVFDGQAWGQLPAPPGSIGQVPTATWTGNELVVLGGEKQPETPTDAAFSLRWNDQEG